ncbi:elongation of very long chain fatty acids protein 4 [Formica exsecta]|uniref:elongation of very long chain fatty acids protein 4 n=1 Tax=Formica exsecta TaxID=72781 RepID=UPI0011435924|nr:elongation of very long chain fatty acids protein 4 [Formica exsecta]
MANLIRLVVNNYNDVLKNVKDPLVDTWPLMGSPGPLICIVSAYLIFVLKAGPKMMEKRSAFQLNTVMIVYNAFQVLFSIWLTSLTVNVNIKHLILNIFSSHGCGSHFLPDAETKHVQAALLRGAWWYFFAKIIELLDTVFFVLRKKQNQVTFLHVYHHTITAIFSWCYLKLLPGEQGVIVAFLNSIVHVIMYSYYFIASLGSKYRKYLWWKKYMTCIQLIQFGIMLFYLILTLAMDCRMPKALTYFFVTNVIIFIYLFSDFYRKTYKTKTA